ncbi:MAG: glycosyltransferase family 4 protein [Rhodocyclaceae bacterium]|nr:glycosyltransferase family 4 protein [Rhodocyclaceae bacterium]
MTGGAEFQAKLLCDALVAAGRFDVVWISRRVAPDFRPVGHRVVKLPGPKADRPGSHLLLGPELLSVLEAEAPDVIYQRNGTPFTGFAAHFARRSGRRMVWHVARDDEAMKAPWSLGDLRRPMRRLEKMCLEYGARHATRIVVQTRHQESLLMQHYGRKADLMVRNFHPLPAESIDKSGVRTVLWVANLKDMKQPEVFLRLAERHAGRRDVKFAMIGRPSSDAGLMNRIREFGTRNPHFSYLGELTQDQVNGLLATSHLLVNTSKFEGFSNTFIQAWMRGVPVLSLNADPDGLLLERGIGYCAAGDEEALARELAALLGDGARLGAMGDRGRAYALAEHTEANIGSLIGLLDGD